MADSLDRRGALRRRKAGAGRLELERFRESQPDPACVHAVDYSIIGRMFDSAGLDHRVAKAAYRREVAKLRTALLDAQYDLSRDGRFAALIVIAGVQGAGKGETIHQLAEWMDPRHLLTTGFAEPSSEERERPRLWRYWNALPPRGRIGVFFGAWHTEPIVARARGKMSSAELALALDEIVRLEKLLCDEGMLLLKYWFHVSKKRQRKRLEAIGEKPATPYGKFVAAAESVVRRTSTGEAPWIVVPGADGRSSFQGLQNAFDLGRDRDIVYYVFDAPFLEGKDLRRIPLLERKKRLEKILKLDKKLISKEFSGAVVNIITRNFHFKPEQVAEKFRLKMGEGKYLIGTTLADDSRVILCCERIR